MLVFLAIVCIITFPITSAFNALVIIAVKTKPRLRNMSNIALACLATTDGIMGVIGQPLFVAMLIANMQGDISSAYCSLNRLVINVIRVLVTSSLFHLVVINIERYIAIKHSFEYITVVTEARILRSSAVAWIIALLLTGTASIIDSNPYFIVSNITSILCMVTVILCQVVLYRETRRQQKKIAAQQVSVEARKKFLKEQKAFKVTTTVLFFLILTYSPILVARILMLKSVINSVNGTYITIFVTASILVLLNSLINPCIYCIRIRQFRVAFIELLFRKSNTQAEDIDMRIFGTLNVLAPVVQRQGREENQNNEQENSAHRDNIDEHSERYH